MIVGKDIASKLIAFIHTGPAYDPDKRVGSGPVTMRDLVTGNFPTIGGCAHAESIGTGEPAPPILSFVPDGPTGITDVSKMRIRPAVIDMVSRPKAPPKVGDFTGYYTLLSSFYEWLEKNKMHKGIDIDHALADYHGTWPLWEKMVYTVGDRSGFDFECLFPQEYMLCEGEGPDFDCAYVPLYQCDDAYDYVPLIELLHNLPDKKNKTVRLPEAAYASHDSPIPVTIAEAVLCNVCIGKKYQHLDAEWDAAFRAIDAFPHGYFASWEYYQDNRLEIQDAADIQHLFDCCNNIGELQRHLDPFVTQCETNSGSFWRSFVEMLNGIAKKHPKLGQYKEKVKGPKVKTRG